MLDRLGALRLLRPRPVVAPHGSKLSPAEAKRQTGIAKVQNIPDLSASSSNTLNAANLLGSTPCRLKICIDALENPQAGVSGVPFMNSTTGALPTAASIEALVSADRYLLIDGVRSCGNVEGIGVKVGRAMVRDARSAWVG